MTYHWKCNCNAYKYFSEYCKIFSILSCCRKRSNCTTFIRLSLEISMTCNIIYQSKIPMTLACVWYFFYILRYLSAQMPLQFYWETRCCIGYVILYTENVPKSHGILIMINTFSTYIMVVDIYEKTLETNITISFIYTLLSTQNLYNMNRNIISL